MATMVAGVLAPGVAAGAPQDEAPGAPAPAGQTAAPEDAEIVSRYVRRWRNPDGSWSLDSSTHQRFFRDALGDWREIDARLVEDEVGGMLRGRALPETAASVAVRLDGDDPLALLGGLGAEVSVSLPYAVATDGVVSDDGYTVVYPKALPGGRDVVVGLRPAGFKDAVRLPDPAAGAKYRLQVEVPTVWSVRDRTSGGVEVVDDGGAVAATYGERAYAYDADDPPAETPVDVSVVEVDGTTATLEVAVDESWLTDETRVYPVTVDPTWETVNDDADHQPCAEEPTSYDACDTWVDSTRPDDTFDEDTKMVVGVLHKREGDLARALLQFPTDDYGTTPQRRYHVSSATVELYHTNGSKDIAHDYDVHGLASAPTGSTTWNTQPTTDSAGLVDRRSIVGDSSWESFDITGLAQRWFDGDPNLGLRVAAADETDVDTKLDFLAGNSDPQKDPPRMVVVYVDWPGAPGEVTATAGDSQAEVSWSAATDGGGTIAEYRIVTVDDGTGEVVKTESVCGTCTEHTVSGLDNGTAYRFEVSAVNETGEGPTGASDVVRPNLPADPPVLVGPDDGAALTGSPAALEVTYADPDGHPGTAQFELQTTGGDPVGSGSSATTTSGETASLPLEPLGDGNYRWRARNVDEFGDASAWSGWWRFDVDATPPQIATLTSPTHPDETGWYTSRDVEVVWTASDTSGMTGFSWTFDQQQDTEPDTGVDAVDPDGDPDDDSYTTSATMDADGEWWFHVRGRNRAGLWGPAVHYRIGIDGGAPTEPDIASSTHPDATAWYAHDDPEATFSATAASGVAGYNYHLDQQPLTAASTTDPPDTLTGTADLDGDLPDGEYWLHVRAKSTIGVWGGTGHHRFGIDDTPPPTPPVTSDSHPDPAVWYADDDVHVDWTTTDTAPITGYSYVLDQTSGTLPDEQVDTDQHTAVLPDLADGTHWLHVRAVNASGLWSADAGHRRFRVDTTPPPAPTITTATHPDPDVWYASDDVEVTWTSDDVSGISGYSWTLDGDPDTVPDTVPDPAPDGGVLADLADGVHHLHVRAINGAGLASATTHRTFRIDDTPPDPPTVDSTSHPSTTRWYSKDDVAVSWDADDTAPVVEYRYVLDHDSGTVPGELASHTTGSGRLFTDRADGQWWLHVRARNAAGLWSDTSHRRIRIDTTPPDLTSLTSPTHPEQARWYTARDATVEWTYRDPHAGIMGYSWELDRMPTTTPDKAMESSWATSADFADLDDGQWWFHIRARDDSGNWSGPAHFGIKVVPRCAGTSDVVVSEPTGVAFAGSSQLVTGTTPRDDATVTVSRDADGDGTYSGADATVATVDLGPDTRVYELDVPLVTGEPNCLFVHATGPDGRRWGPTAVPVVFSASGSGGGSTSGSADTDGGTGGGTHVPGQLAVKALDADTDLSLLPEVVYATRMFPGTDDGTLARWWYVKVPAGAETTLLATYAVDPRVDVAELVPVVRTASTGTPVDRFYDQPFDPDGDGQVDDGEVRPQIDWLGPDGIDAAPAWIATDGGQGTRGIAVIDSGVFQGFEDTDGDGTRDRYWVHPDLANQLPLREFDCVTTGGPCNQVDEPAETLTNHGTGVAGIAAAQTDATANWPAEDGGIAGVGFDTDFLSYRVLTRENPDLGGTECWSVPDDLCWAPRAIQLAADRAATAGVGVVNLSLGSLPYTSNFDQADLDGWPDHWQDVVNYAGRRGVSVVASAGNYCPDDEDESDNCDNDVHGTVGVDTFPARAHGAIAVGGLDTASLPASEPATFVGHGDERGKVTNRGVWVDLAAPATQLAAPGVRQLTGPYATDDDYGMFLTPGFEGTSGAAPQVAGGIALLTSSTRPSWQRPPLRAEHRVLSAAAPFEPAHGNLGRGMLDLHAAVDRRAVRLSGSDRYQTAVEVSREVHPGGSRLPDAVVLATGDDAADGSRFSDALAATGLAGAVDAPVLLVSSPEINRFERRSSVVRNEIDRLLGCPSPGGQRPSSRAGDPPLVYVIGGHQAVSPDLEPNLGDCFDPDPDIVRIAGTDRWATAASIGRRVVGSSGQFEAALTSGQNFPDAMVMSPWTAATGSPLLLTATDTLPGSTAEFLRDHCDRITRLYIAGGTAAVSDGVRDAAHAALTDPSRGCPSSDRIERVAGVDRYATARAVALGLFGSPDGAIVAAGDRWPDGIAGGPLTNVGLEVEGRRWPLLLTPSPSGANPDPALHPDTDRYVGSDRSDIDHAYLLGGLAATGRRAYLDLDQAVLR